MPGSGWAFQIVSVYVVQPIYVDISVTDAYLTGDYFEVYEVNGISPTTASLIGTTPSVPTGGGGVSDPDIAFDDPNYSHDTFRVLLQSGKHYFAFREVGHNFGGGGFFARFCPGPAIGAVGGNLAPANRLTVVSPLVAMLSIFGIVLVVVAAKRKKL